MAMSHDEEIRAAAMAMACQYLQALATIGTATAAAPSEAEMYEECMEAATVFAEYIKTGAVTTGQGGADVVMGR